MSTDSLNYNKKLIGLALLKVVDFDVAANAFINVCQTTFKESKENLLALKNNHLLLVWGILEKRDQRFYFYEPSPHYFVSVVNEGYLDGCISAKRVSLERAMDMLKERQ